MNSLGITHFLVLSSLLFSIGLVCALTRKNALSILIGIELILNAAGLNFVAFSRYGNFGIEGPVFTLFIIVLAAAEAVVALAMIFTLQKKYKTVDVDRTDSLRG